MLNFVAPVSIRAHCLWIDTAKESAGPAPAPDGRRLRFTAETLAPCQSPPLQSLVSWQSTGPPFSISGIEMVKTTLIGIIWCVVLYLLGCAIVGGVAGGIAGASDPENASAVGAQAGAAVVAAYRPFIFFGAAAVAFVGSWSGMLPGTKRNKAEPTDGE